VTRQDCHLALQCSVVYGSVRCCVMLFDIHAYMYVYIRVNIYMYAYIYIHIHCINIVYIFHKCVYICINIYISIYIYIHTYRYICISTYM